MTPVAACYPACFSHGLALNRANALATGTYLTIGTYAPAEYGIEEAASASQTLDEPLLHGLLPVPPPTLTCH